MSRKMYSSSILANIRAHSYETSDTVALRYILGQHFRIIAMYDTEDCIHIVTSLSDSRNKIVFAPFIFRGKPVNINIY